MPLTSFTIPALPAAPHRLTLTSPPALNRRSLSPTKRPLSPTKPTRQIPLSTAQTIKSLYCSGQHKQVISAVTSLHLDSYLPSSSSSKKSNKRPLTKQQKLTIATLWFLVGESRRELAFRQRRYLSDRRSFTTPRPGSSSSADSDDVVSHRLSNGFAVTETQRQAREHLEMAKRAFGNAMELVQSQEVTKEEEEEMDWVEKVKWERVETAAAEFVGCVREKMKDVEEELSLGGRKGWRQRRQSGEIQG